MRKILIALMLLCNTAAFADWLPAAQLLPSGTSPEVEYDVYTTYNAGNQTVVATWGNYFLNSPDPIIDQTPYYAVYDGVTWITPGTVIPQGASAGVSDNIIPAYYGKNQTVVAVWSDSAAFVPYYAVFDGTTWITPGTAIPLGTSSGVYDFVTIVYDPAAQTIIAAWSDITNQLPYYSVFDGTTWVTTALIPVGASAGAKNDVMLTYDAARQTVVAAWADRVSQLPFYAVFDGTTWTTPGTAIPQGASAGVNFNVNLVFNGANSTVLAAWGDSSDTTPYYAVFNGTTWVPARVIPQGPNVGPYQEISLAYNSDTGQVFASWSDNANYQGFYSIFNGSTWTTGATLPVIPSLGVDYNIILVYDPYVHQMVATWANYPGLAIPYFSIFATPLPANLTGRGCCNSFATQKVWVNHFEWTPTLSAIGYNIYRNGVFIAHVGAGVSEYNDAGNRVGDEEYSVIAVFANALDSIPATVTIPAHRVCK